MRVNLSKLSKQKTLQIFTMGCKFSRYYNQIQVDTNTQESSQVQAATFQEEPVQKPQLLLPAKLVGWNSPPVAEKAAVTLLGLLMAEHKEKLERARELAKWA